MNEGCSNTAPYVCFIKAGSTFVWFTARPQEKSQQPDHLWHLSPHWLPGWFSWTGWLGGCPLLSHQSICTCVPFEAAWLVGEDDYPTSPTPPRENWSLVKSIRSCAPCWNLQTSDHGPPVGEHGLVKLPRSPDTSKWGLLVAACLS